MDNYNGYLMVPDEQIDRIERKIQKIQGRQKIIFVAAVIYLFCCAGTYIEDKLKERQEKNTEE